MDAELKRAFPSAEVTLIPGGRGDFIVKVDGQEVWNKKQTHDGEFPNDTKLVAGLKG